MALTPRLSRYSPDSVSAEIVSFRSLLVKARRAARKRQPSPEELGSNPLAGSAVGAALQDLNVEGTAGSYQPHKLRKNSVLG